MFSDLASFRFEKPAHFVFCIIQLKDLLSEKIEIIRTHLIDGLIVPLQNQIEEVRKDKANKAKKLEEARAEIKLQSEKKAVLLEQQRTITELGKSVLVSSVSGN